MTSQLLSRLDNNIEVALSKFQELCKLSTVEDKSYEMQSVEALQIESDAWIIIRVAQELLSLTRTLREKWVLGQAGGEQDKAATPEEIQRLYLKVNALLDTITEERSVQ